MMDIKDKTSRRCAIRYVAIYNIVFCASILGLSTSGCAEQSTALRTGAAVYESTCAKCHGGDGLGVNDAFPALVGSARLAGDTDPIAELVLRGARGPIQANGEVYNGVMTPLSFLRDEEIANVINYARATFVSAFDSIDARRVAVVRERTRGQGILDISQIWPDRENVD